MVQDALDKIRQERNLTTITVAHRLTTIINSDKIVVIADGSIQEAGTHRELVEENGSKFICSSPYLLQDTITGIIGNCMLLI